MMVELSAGNRVAGYALLARLASTGLADVWLARDTKSKGHIKTVVVKTITQRRNTPPELLPAIFSEAQEAADLDHPNIVQVFDVAPHLDSFFIAMEYVAGRTLRQILNQLRYRRLVPPQGLVIHVAQSVCEALQYAHVRRRDSRLAPIIHRDIRPENIILSFTGDTKILAFGTARASMIDALHGAVAPYLPPTEDVGSLYSSQDPFIDIYSLGVTVAECLTGDVLCWNDDGWTSGDLPTLRNVAPWISGELDVLVCRAMAQSPNRRYRTIGEFGDALSHYLKSTGARPMRSQLAKYLCLAFADDGAGLVDLSDGKLIGPDDRLGAEVATGRKSEIPHPMHLDWGDSEFEPLSVREPSRELILPQVPQDTPIEDVDPTDSHASQLALESDEKGHVWDLLTERVRAERVARESNPDIDMGQQVAALFDKEQSSQEPSHGWDAAVRKARTSEPGQPKATSPKSLLSPSERAMRIFDEGLACMREKNYDRAFGLWNEAARLDPENRLYQTNLRRLKKLMDEKPSG